MLIALIVPILEMILRRERTAGNFAQLVILVLVIGFNFYVHLIVKTLVRSIMRLIV